MSTPTTIEHHGVPVRVLPRFAMTGYQIGDDPMNNAGISPSTDGPWMAVCRREPLGTYSSREEAEQAALDALVGPLK